MDLIGDCWTYLKERKDHPIVFPIIVVWTFVHWDIFYALMYSKFGFAEMVKYVDSGIHDASKTKEFFGLIAGYLWAIPVVKLVSAIYNDTLEMVKIWYDRIRENQDLKALKLKRETYEEREKQSNARRREFDMNLYSTIAASFREEPIVSLISENSAHTSEYINADHLGLSELRKLMLSISAPSNIHYSPIIRETQKQLISDVSILQATISSTPRIQMVDPDENSFSDYLEIKDKDSFYEKANSFMMSYRKYIESIKDASE